MILRIGNTEVTTIVTSVLLLFASRRTLWSIAHELVQSQVAVNELLDDALDVNLERRLRCLLLEDFWPADEARVYFLAAVETERHNLETSARGITLFHSVYGHGDVCHGEVRVPSAGVSVELDNVLHL